MSEGTSCGCGYDAEAGGWRGGVKGVGYVAFLAFLGGLGGFGVMVVRWRGGVGMVVQRGSRSLLWDSLGMRLVASERRCVEFRRHDILWFSLV